MKKIMLLAIGAMFVSSAYSQINLNFEAGTSAIYGDVSENKRLREKNIWGEELIFIGSKYLSVMPEYDITEHASIMGGVRVVVNNTNYNVGDGSFAYWRYDEQGTNTYCYRIENIEQQSIFLGVPFVAKWSVRGHSVKVSPFFKAGVAFNFNLSQEIDVDMLDESLEDECAHRIKNEISTSSFYFNEWLSAGVDFGEKNKFSFEIIFPTIILGKSPTKLCDDTGFGFGAVFSWRMPLITNNSNN